MKYDDIAKDLQFIRAALFTSIPWFSIFLGKLRVVGVEDMPCDAAVNGCGVLFINVKSWRAASRGKRIFILLHEVLHVALKHFSRAMRILRADGVLSLKLYNAACDCAVNELAVRGFKHLAGELPEDYVNALDFLRAAGVRADEVPRMSCEEIYMLLRREAVRSGKPPRFVTLMVCDLGFDRGYSPEDLVQEGSPEIYSSQDGVEEAVEGALRRALVLCRKADLGPGTFSDAIEKALRPKVDWRAELRTSARQGLGVTMVSTWGRMNRKLPGLCPAAVRYRVPDVYCVVDVSGSIGERELNQFFAEVFAVAGISKVIAVFFDSEVRGVCRVRRGMIPRVIGGGGTLISPALRLVYNMAKYGDVVVVLTDGLVSDEAEQEKWLNKLKWKTSVVYCSTARFPKAAVRKILMEVGE